MQLIRWVPVQVVARSPSQQAVATSAAASTQDSSPEQPEPRVQRRRSLGGTTPQLLLAEQDLNLKVSNVQRFHSLSTCLTLSSLMSPGGQMSALDVRLLPAPFKRTSDGGHQSWQACTGVVAQHATPCCRICTSCLHQRLILYLVMFLHQPC